MIRQELVFTASNGRALLACAGWRSEDGFYGIIMTGMIQLIGSCRWLLLGDTIQWMKTTVWWCAACTGIRTSIKYLWHPCQQQNSGLVEGKSIDELTLRSMFVHLASNLPCQYKGLITRWQQSCEKTPCSLWDCRLTILATWTSWAVLTVLAVRTGLACVYIEPDLIATSHLARPLWRHAPQVASIDAGR